jgi:hypothetical protein
MPVILATQEAEIRRIAVGSQPGQTVDKKIIKTKQNTKQQQKSQLTGQLPDDPMIVLLDICPAK